MKNLPLYFISCIVLFHSTFINAQSSVQYLSILSPSSIVGTYRDSSNFREASGWGGSFPGNKFNGQAMIPDVDDLLCKDDKTDFAGKIAIIRRGTCEFSAKALYAQNRGAACVIIVNFENALVTMGAGTLGNQVTIPAFFITKDLGELIINVLKNQENVVLSFGNNPEGFGLIQGFVRQDLNGNCLSDTSNKGLRDWSINVKDKSGSNFKIKSNNQGFYRRYLSPLFGPYKLSVEPKNTSWLACDLEKEVQVTDHDTSTLNFTVISNKDCIELHTEITASRLRRCFDSDFYINVCNEGTITAK